ncbi:AraC family transcriptional regulator [Aestuariibius sp. 2305UL40-4]|uniref:helix-turn-helix transcriptional regulator n=1 Tax=Aestuariibius violaceus TaxID=3234132 RepID=UPI00345E3339
MSIIQILSREVLGPGEALHFSRSVLPRSRATRLHGHDFHEVFWIQHGRARHRINDRAQELEEGDIVFIRPRDVHALQGRGEETHMVNVILSDEVLAPLRARHAELAGRFFWSEADLPERHPRDIRQLTELSRTALMLETGARGVLQAEAFLLPLFAGLMPAAAAPEDAPDWLLRACAAAREPRVFREGAAGFVRVTGRAHAHVSRTARRFLGQSPSEYVNSVRMEHAARRLVGTEDSLAEIATDCGIPNLSHFHRLFRQHHGATPHAYRKQRQHRLVAPRPEPEDA